jgi:hypothetical protein
LKAPKASASPIGGLTQPNDAFKRYREIKLRKALQRRLRRLRIKKATNPNTTGDLFGDDE